MFQESSSEIPSSVWTSMNSWFTPTVLFLLLNLMIGTIAFTSAFANQKQEQNETNEPKIARSPSVLHRLKSINFYYRSQEPQTQTHSVHHKPNPDSGTLFELNRNLETESHYFFQENLRTHEPQGSETQFVSEHKESSLHDFEETHDEKDEEDQLQSMDEIYSKLKGSHFTRSKSDTPPTSGMTPKKLPAKMKKSASLKSSFGHFEEVNIVEARRPATVREKGSVKVTDGDDEVDAKADDFINKFKHQLKLQRLDSIVRYKDMIGRGSGGE